MSSYIIVQKDELYHHGTLGQKWGIRRYQNYDGTLTAKGKARIASLEKKSAKVQKRMGGRDYQIKQIRSRKLDTNRAQKLAAKRTKLESQKGKLAVKNQRAKNKVLMGQNISGRDRKRLAKEYKLDAKIGKIAKKQDPYKAKVQDLERRNSIDQKKLDKLAKKIDKIGTPNEKMMAKARAQIEKYESIKLSAMKDNERLAKEYNTLKDRSVLNEGLNSNKTKIVKANRKIDKIKGNDTGGKYKRQADAYQVEADEYRRVSKNIKDKNDSRDFEYAAQDAEYWRDESMNKYNNKHKRRS